MPSWDNTRNRLNEKTKDLASLDIIFASKIFVSLIDCESTIDIPFKPSSAPTALQARAKIKAKLNAELQKEDEREKIKS